MKIICVSDTHLQHNFSVPDGDMILHAGDATWRGNYAEVFDFALWYSRLPHKHKVFVAGNHDWGFQKDPAIFREFMTRNGIIYLEDSGVEIGGLKIWGSPWQPEFGGWAFNLPRGEKLARKWAMIPDDTQVLITHGPPKNILDKTNGGGYMTPSGEVYDPSENVGCKDLMDRIKTMTDLRLHVFGHIHASYGQMSIARTTFVNASICNEHYKPVNAPVVVDL